MRIRIEHPATHTKMLILHYVHTRTCTRALAKRKKRNKQGQKALIYKIVALPANPTYEPWILDILKSLQKHQARLNFHINRQRVFQIINLLF